MSNKASTVDPAIIETTIRSLSPVVFDKSYIITVFVQTIDGEIKNLEVDEFTNLLDRELLSNDDNENESEIVGLRLCIDTARIIQDVDAIMEGLMKDIPFEDEI